MQFWLLNYNPGPLAQGLGNWILLSSSPLNIHSVTATLFSQFSQSLWETPCGAEEAFMVSLAPDQPVQSQGWKHQCGGTEAERGSRGEKVRSEMVTVWGDWALGGIRLPHSVREGWRPHLVLQISRCGMMARVSQMGCGDTCRAGVSPGAAAEVPEVIQPQHPGTKMFLIFYDVCYDTPGSSPSKHWTLWSSAWVRICYIRIWKSKVESVSNWVLKINAFLKL